MRPTISSTIRLVWINALLEHSKPVKLAQVIPLLLQFFSFRLDCPSHCETCDENQCLTCETGYFIYNKACVNSCPTKMYFTGTTCKNCPNNCKACNAVECSACDSNYLLYNKQCIASCPSKTYETSSTCIGIGL